MKDRIIRPAEAEKLVGYTSTHLLRLEEKDLFPRRFKLNPESGLFGAVGWLESDIEAWMEARASSRGPLAFLLDKGVRAKAGTLSDTDTNDSETPPPGRIPSPSQPQSRNSTDFQNPPLVKDDVSSESAFSDPENFSENSEPTPLVNESSGNLINTEDGEAEPPELEVPRCPLSGVKRT